MLLAALLGCGAPVVVRVDMLAPVGAHYLVIDGDGLAWDCYSELDDAWRPTCVRVDYRGSPPP